MQISHLFLWENLKSQTARLTQETITESDIFQRVVVWLVISGTDRGDLLPACMKLWALPAFKKWRSGRVTKLTMKNMFLCTNKRIRLVSGSRGGRWSPIPLVGVWFL